MRGVRVKGGRWGGGAGKGEEGGIGLHSSTPAKMQHQHF